ncbi:MAG: nicotinate-nucleotide adenylyltransferase [Chloroflexi bacterium]|nr:nicotinate-nucleotide adenylyltransferase [Chloroflexota bacterium]
MTAGTETQKQRTAIGVLGGTFDPPHNGHLAIAMEALGHLGLAQVLFAPARQPPHKAGHAITPIEHRLRMVELAIGQSPRLALSRVDVDREPPTFSADTMRLLNESFGPQTELYFIMGLDSLASILNWHAPDQLIRECRLAVFYRPGFIADLDSLEARLPGLRARLTIMPSPNLDISATEIQRRIGAGESIAQMVPPLVARYIGDHGLYQNSPGL